jgi:hypothetical protein
MRLVATHKRAMFHTTLQLCMPAHLSVIKVLAAVMAVGSPCAGWDVRYFLCVAERGLRLREICFIVELN